MTKRQRCAVTAFLLTLLAVALLIGLLLVELSTRRVAFDDCEVPYAAAVAGRLSAFANGGNTLPLTPGARLLWWIWQAQAALWERTLA